MIFAGRVPVIIAVILISMNMLYIHHHMDDGHDIEIPVIENVLMEDEFHTTRSGGKQLEMPRTGLYMEPGDTSWISESDNIESVNGEYIQIDEKVLTGRSRFESSVYTAYRSLNSRSIQEYKGILFMSYVTYESSPSDSYHCWLAASFDQGETWSSREVFSRSGLDSASVDLLVYQDKIFYLAKYFSQSTNLRLSHITVTPYLNWRNISGVQYKEIIPDRRMDTSSLVGHGDHVMLFWRGADSRPYYMIYMNNTWIEQIDILPLVSTYCPVSSTLNGAPILYLFYTSSPSPDILMINSTDGGVTWGSHTRVGNSGGDLTYMVGVSSGEIAHLALTKEDENSIRYVRYDPGASLYYSDIATYGLNGLDGDDRELSMSTDGRRIAVAFEDSAGTISIIKSYDGGSTFTGRSKIGSGSAHCPSMDRDHRYMMFINGSDVEVLAWSESDSGMIRTGVISPAGVVSWDQYAFSVGGVADPYSFGFRVISPDGSIQHYPDAGYKHLDGLSDGNLSSLYFGHIGNFDGSFSSGSGLADDIVIEMRFLKSNEDNPLLFGLFINFTVSYPYREDYYGGYHVEDLDNCFISSVGIELEDGETSGEAILGPYYIEDMPPDHLSIRCSFVNDENYVKASVLGGDHQPVYGYNYSDTDNMVISDEERYILWNQRSLGNLPDSVSIFYIGLKISRSDTISPKINWLNLGDSMPPFIMDVAVDSPEIYRGESSEISIDMFDREEPGHMLDISLETRDPLSEQWSGSLVSDSIFIDGSWKFIFRTEYNTNPGEYRLRAYAVDSVGSSSGYIDLDRNITVLNNPPSPPLVSLTFEPYTGQYLDISTVKPGSDLEVPLDDLTYNLSVIVDGEVISNLSNLHDLDIEYREKTMLKNEEWRIIIHSWDGIDPSSPFEAIWVVNNTPPVINNIQDIKLKEDQDPWELPLDSWFYDIDNDSIFYEITAPKEIIVTEANDSFFLSAVEDFNGISYIRIRASDGESSIDLNLTLTINPENDPPLWNDPGIVTVSEGDWVFIDIGAVDDRDGEVPVVVHNIAEIIPGLNKGDNFHVFPNGSIKLRTDNDMVGSHDIEMIISDSEHELITGYSIEVMNVNQPPDKPSISLEKMKRVFIFGEDITLFASGSDPDLKWGDNLTYSWSSDLVGNLGEGITIAPDLGIGVHRVEVTAIDSYGSVNSTSISITVLEPEEESVSVIRTWMLYTIVGAIGLFLGVIVAATIVIIGGRSRDKDVDDASTEETGHPRIAGQKDSTSRESGMSDYAKGGIIKRSGGD